MTGEALPPPQSKSALWLAQHDLSLAAGEAGVPEDMPADEHDLLDCLRLLGRAWPRATKATGTGPQSSESSLLEPTELYQPREPAGEPPSSLADRPLRTFSLPGFTILDTIGQGGMGVVYRARQLRLDREVAIKVLPPGLAENPTLLKRFRNEAAVAASLTDARVLPVFDVLEVGGVPVLVMPFVDGTNLGQILSDRRAARRGESGQERHPWSTLSDRDYLDRVVPVLDQVVDAVAAIHEHEPGIIHRDIKPSNILVDRRGNVFLSDFGLARLEEQVRLTQGGQELGTRGFMSPEQWEGREDIDKRTDVFALGATLYQALTLELPYGRWRLDLRSPPPLAPSKRQPLLAADFDTVLLKALELDRTARYASAVAFRDDWQRVRNGLPPLGRRMGRLQRLGRWARRHPAGLANAALLGGMLLVVGWLLQPPPITLRTIALTTDPPGARVVLVPLDRRNGEPQPERAIRPDDEQTTPLQLDVSPGDYLIEVEVPGRGFHEVVRRVPAFDQQRSGAFLHNSWSIDSEGVVVLNTIEIPARSAIEGMAFFGGADDFLLGDGGLPSIQPHRRDVPAFYLDTTEVCMEDYRRVLGGLPNSLRDAIPKDDHAVVHVSFNEAVHYAETVGKRLPSEAEYEFAATAGGRQVYPWGDDSVRVPAAPWPLGPVGQPDWDRTATEPPVFGLYSNVAEWTTSWLNAYPIDESVLPKYFDEARIVRGGPFSVVSRQTIPGEPDFGPRWRHAIFRDFAHPGLGFRCARSARPRFLDPNPNAEPDSGP